MRHALASQLHSIARQFQGGSFARVRPVALAGIATALLFASVDHSQPWTLSTAIMGAGLLAAVLAQQLNEILLLDERLQAKARQLTVVSEVVSTLNSSPALGGSLGPALQKLAHALGARAGLVWLPSANADSGLVLVESLGLGSADAAGELLASIQAARPSSCDRVVRHRSVIPGKPELGTVEALTALMGREGEELGYLTLMAPGVSFDPSDAAVLSAVATDIGGALRSVRMVSEARKLADRDPVTGLLNHRSVHQRLHAEVERHALSSNSLAVVMMDLDNFKRFNDTYGHPAGDEVLKRVAGVLRRTCRETDVLARYGGDEFMVILPETSVKQALRAAERIRTALSKERFRCERSDSLPIGFSYGIAIYPDDTLDAKDLIAVADAHLYQSKSQGGNQITARGQRAADTTLPQVHGFDLFWAMVVAIDNKDGYTGRHSEEVTEYSLQIARAMGLPPDALETVRAAGMIHDVGKIGVPDSILKKPGKLTDEEFAVMQQHPAFGSLIVGAIPAMEEVVLGVRHHHERFDGRGYPDHLAGEQIPLIGRIMAVADAFSAMTTTRPYRRGLTEKQALQEIRRGLGTQFDPVIGHTFVQVRETALTRATAARPPRRRKVAGAGEAPRPHAVEQADLAGVSE